MAFKQNLPIPVILTVCVLAGLGAAVFLHEPPEEDQIRQAVDRYAATLGPVKQLEIHGTVADIIAGDKNTLIYAEFEKRDGTWTYARNLAEEFSRAMKDPDTQKKVLSQLGGRVSQRFQSAVTFNEGLRGFEYELHRDPSLGAVVGTCTVSFAYPGGQRRGQYVETFHWKEGRWQSTGPGSLFDRVGP